MPDTANSASQSQTAQCSESLSQAVSRAVESAIASKFPTEPLFDPSLARLLSVCGSIVKRHGPLVESAIAEALVESGADVWQRVKVPFTRTAMTFAASPDYALNRNRLLSHDEESIAGYFDADILAVDEHSGWACALQVRRGGGATEPVKRKRLEREIRALDLTLASWLRQQGCSRVECAAVALVDWLGQAGFPEDIVLHGEDLDYFLDAHATAKIDAMSFMLRQQFNRRLGDLLKSVIPFESPPHDEVLEANPSDGCLGDTGLNVRVGRRARTREATPLQKALVAQAPKLSSMRFARASARRNFEVRAF